MSDNAQQLKENKIQNIKEGNDFVINKPTQLQLMNDRNRLQQEVKFLNDINTRLGKELAKSQVKLGIKPGNQPLLGDSLKDLNSVSYNVQVDQRELQYLEPLLLAYDDKLEKMEHTLNMVYEDMQELDRKSEAIVEENIFLRTELEGKCESILQNYKKNQGDINSAFSQLDFNDLQERLNLVCEENKELLQKYKEISQKYNNMKKALEQKSEEHQISYLKVIELQDKNKDVEIMLNDQKHLTEILENKIKNYSEAIAFSDTEKNDLLSKLARDENEIKLLKTQVSNLKKVAADYEERTKQEQELISKDYEQLKNKERDSFNKIIFMEREIDTFKEENRKLKKELDQNKNDCEQMIKMMENYEQKVTQFQKKDENMQRLQKEQRDKVQECLLERDRALLKEQQLEKQIESLHQKYAEELHQQKIYNEKLLDNIKQKHANNQEKLEEELNTQNELNTNLELQNERLTKENSGLRAENNKLQQFLKDELTGQNEDKIGEYERRAIELEEKIQLTEQLNTDKLHSLNLEKQSFEQNFKNLQKIHNEVKSQYDLLKTSTTQIQQENQSLKSRLNSSQREKQNVLEEINRIKKHYETKQEYAQEEQNRKVAELQIMMQDMAKREKNSREKAIELLQNHDRMEEKMRFEYESRIKELETYIMQLKSSQKQITNKFKQLQDDRPVKDAY